MLFAVADVIVFQDAVIMPKENSWAQVQKGLTVSLKPLNPLKKLNKINGEF